MYPTLKTKRLILRNLQTNDIDDMLSLYAMHEILEGLGGFAVDRNGNTDRIKEDIKEEIFYAICLKPELKIIGVILLYPVINKNKGSLRYCNVKVAIHSDYQNIGICTEATEKLLHFAFLGMNSPAVFADQLGNNPAAGTVLKKCGFTHKFTYDCPQYWYDRKDYLKNTGFNPDENAYDYTFPIIKSPYSYTAPIRKIDGITYIKQPTGYLCGQAVIAMLANVSIDEVVEILHNDKGISDAELKTALKWYGLKLTANKRTKYEGGELPECAILGVKLPGYGHWSLYYKGKFYDPEFGVSDDLYENAVLRFYYNVCL
jgi:RimJ/RimL family protein N-acetyltransferase